MTGHLGNERSYRNPWTPWDSELPAPEGTCSARVYCLPHAGGSAGSYLEWSRCHDVPGLRFVPVELPGRGTRLAEPLLYSMDKVVDGLLSMLESRPEREGFLFFGHSMGAKIAYETTRRLTVAGRPLPRAVVVSCSRPPGSPVAVPLHDHDDGDLLEGIIEIGGIPAELRQRPDLLRILLPVMRADLVLEARYAEQVRPTVLPCPIVALTGADDRYAGPQWIGGWRTMTKGAFRYRIFPGEHFFLQEQVAEVIAEIAHIAAGTLPDEVWAQTSSP